MPRWSPEEIRSHYDAAFPGMEHLLEAEFNRFRDGLSRTDELKLYGSYTLWALFLSQRKLWWEEVSVCLTPSSIR